MSKQHESLSDYQDLLSGSFDQMTEISSGGGGIIIKAHHKGLDKEVIIKKVIRSKVNTLGKTGERDALKNLKHNCLPQIYDYFEYGDDVFTVMEFIPGESFAQILSENTRKFKRKELIKWTTQLCDVVNYLHSRKPAIIHCDIKPGNVMLTPEGNICLIDFNISNVKSGEDLSTIGYTPGYAPAEQFFLWTQNRMRRQYQKSAAPVNTLADSDIPLYDSVFAQKGEVVSSDEATQIDDASYDEATVVDDEMTQVDSDMPVQAVPLGSVQSNSAVVTPAVTDSFDGWTTDKVLAVVQRNGIKAQIDERTDIYSIGATLYHIATGIKPSPFYAKTIHVQELNPSIPDGLAFIIQKAMSLKPQDRFSDCSVMLKVAGQINRIDKRYKRFGRVEAALVLIFGLIMITGMLISQHGMRLMENEKSDRYDELVTEMSELRETGSYEEMNEIYLRAVELEPSRADAYFEMGLALYQSRRYEECIGFIKDEVLTNMAVVGMDTKGSFYYLVASSYFETEDYQFAIEYFKKAIKVDSANASYYRDYVIALARTGDISGAEKEIKNAEEAGAKEDILKLLEGEIYYADSKYSLAQQSLITCIEDTKDDEVLLRAYSKLDDVLTQTYHGAEQYDMRVAYLEEALMALPSQSSIILMERLAQVYMDYSEEVRDSQYDRKALDLSFQIRDEGYGTFQTDYNIAVLYEKLSLYEDAIAWSLKMIEDRGENYRWYKRMAFAELRRQGTMENTSRDYGTFKDYYNKAASLYKENATGTDQEMFVLDNSYNELVDLGWLND